MGTHGPQVPSWKTAHFLPPAQVEWLFFYCSRHKRMASNLPKENVFSPPKFVKWSFRLEKFSSPKKSHHLRGVMGPPSWDLGMESRRLKTRNWWQWRREPPRGKKPRDSCVENVIWLHHVRGEWKKHQPTHGFHWLHRRVWRGSWHFTAWLQLKTISRF